MLKEYRAASTIAIAQHSAGINDDRDLDKFINRLYNPVKTLERMF